MRQLRALWSAKATDFDHIMLWAACCTAFFGFFRMGEITTQASDSFDASRQLMIADMAVDNEDAPTVFKIHLKRTKTTQFSGVDVYLGSTGNCLCPVAALMAYIAVRMSAGPLFWFQSGRFLTKRHSSHE